MTEPDWLTSNDPHALLHWLIGSPLHEPCPIPPPSDRKRVGESGLLGCKMTCLPGRMSEPEQRPLPADGLYTPGCKEPSMSEQTTPARPFFQPRPECDDLQTAYLLWKIVGTVTIAESGCWEWQGYKVQNGYGRIGVNKKEELVHRLVYRLCVSDLPVSIQVCHHCDNPACLNLAHLFAGTGCDNARDAVAKGRNYLPCPKGGSKARKLSDDAVREIRRKADAGEKVRHLAREYGVSPSVITSVVRRYRYRSVPDEEVMRG